uniref:Uncharacterized protein n=1 Tax=Vombatus ursinus TaxID=29139 RepID=A0A4X2LCJ5_VOMUR
MTASTTSHRPIKGILKKSSFDNAILTTAGSSVTLGPSTEVGAGAGSGKELSKKSQKWDEMSILATYHPEDMDYGLMNIDEPDMLEDESISNSDSMDTTVPELLAQGPVAAKRKEPRFLVHCSESSEDLRWQLQSKRKPYYSQGMHIKFAQQLISREVLEVVQEEEPQDQDMQEEASEMETLAAEASQNNLVQPSTPHPTSRPRPQEQTEALRESTS